jgi:hypothetical protein
VRLLDGHDLPLKVVNAGWIGLFLKSLKGSPAQNRLDRDRALLFIRGMILDVWLAEGEPWEGGAKKARKEV